jgi:hypothetical protein
MSIIAIEPKEFNPSRLVYEAPQSREITIGKDKVITVTSPAKYLNDKGEPCSLYIVAPPQQCFGFSMNGPLGEEATEDNMNGLQLCYEMTSKNTINNPTKAESEFISVIDQIWDASVKEGLRQAQNDDEDAAPVIPNTSTSVFDVESRKKKPNYKNCIKFPYERPRIKDTKQPDNSKSYRFYVKLLTTGKGPKLRVNTKIYGPGDKPVSAIRYISKPGHAVTGVIHPCFFYEGLYWGSHPGKPYGCSQRYRLVQANFTPRAFAQRVPEQRLLPFNNDPVEDDAEENDSPAPLKDTTSDFKPAANTATAAAGGASKSSKKSWASDDEENPIEAMRTKTPAVKPSSPKYDKKNNKKSHHRQRPAPVVAAASAGSDEE